MRYAPDARKVQPNIAGKAVKVNAPQSFARKASAVATAWGASPCTQIEWIGVGRIFPERVANPPALSMRETWASASSVS